ncbi:MAG: voltage-gated potassium channel [Bradymonadia bacterium]|jgi:voltage-gated potassium channel
MIHVFSRLWLRTRAATSKGWITGVALFMALLFYSTAGFMYFELPIKPDMGWIDAFWWSIVTMTTVGYGDYFPASFGGRFLVCVPTMLVGIGLLGYLLSVFSGAVLETRMKTLRGLLPVDLKNHAIICRWAGLGPTLKLVEEIRSDPATASIPVVLIDPLLDELPGELVAAGVKFIRGEPSREAVLTRACFRSALFAIVQADAHHPDSSDHRNLTVVLTFERLHPDVRTIVHVRDPENVAFFERANCDAIICTEALSSQLIAQEMKDPGLNSVLAELTTNAHGKQWFIVDAPNVKSFAEVRAFYDNAVVIGLVRGHRNLLAPADDTAVEPGDRVAIIAARRPAKP